MHFRLHCIEINKEIEAPEVAMLDFQLYHDNLDPILDKICAAEDLDNTLLDEVGAIVAHNMIMHMAIMARKRVRHPNWLIHWMHLTSYKFSHLMKHLPSSSLFMRSANNDVKILRR